jgi:predicted aldo/keto reductase-like oxidoreductase
MRLPTIVPGDPPIDHKKAIKMIRRGIDARINYIDTAHNYHDYESEIVVGKALKDGYRDKVTLVTKSPIWHPEFTQQTDFDRYLDASLKQLDIDTIDIYLLHAMNENTYQTKVVDLELQQRFEAAKASGKIRYLGCSYHGSPEALRGILDTGMFEVILVQYNLLDRSYEKLIAYAAERGIGVAVMGPLGGGRLAGEAPEDMRDLLSTERTNFVEYALRFVWSNPHVSVALSGTRSEDVLLDNLNIVSQKNFDTLTPSENETIEKIVLEFQNRTQVICTQCGYCMPCPNGVNIPAIFGLLCNYSVYGRKEEAKVIYANTGKGHIVGWFYNLHGNDATACVECGECLEKCPQQINIIKQLQDAHNILSA